MGGVRRHFKQIGENVHFAGDMHLLNPKCIRIGMGTSFNRHIILTAWTTYQNQCFRPEINIGERCSFGEYNHITAINEIRIGNGVLTGRWVTITDNSHGLFNESELAINPIDRLLYSKGPVVIGDRVWIGDKATILPGVTIGEGCIIAANTVVVEDVPAYCVVAGAPGKIVKRLVN